MATQQPRPRNRGNRPQPQYPQPPPQDPSTEYPFGRPEDVRSVEFLDEANLRVLRMHYPDVESIKFRAHVAHIYKLETASQQYTDVLATGPTFVVALTRTDPDIPRHAIILLNRKNLDVFRINFTPEDDIDMDDNCILVRNSESPDIWCFNIHRGPDTDSAMRNNPEKAQEKVRLAVEEMEEGIKVAEARKAAMASAPQPQWAPQANYQGPVPHAFQQQREGSAASGIQHPYGYPPPAAPSPYPPAQNQLPNPHAFGHPPAYQNMQMQQQQHMFQPAFPPPAPSQTQTPNIDINQLFASVQGQGMAQGFNGAT